MFLRPSFLLLIPCALAAQTVALDPVIVSATRAPESTAQVAFPVTSFSADTLKDSPSTAIDSVLHASPAFSLFRRSDSLTANPTAQGVSLRGLGPSGASRSLVLLDGVPLNDPFGGWVLWAKIPRESLAGAEIVRGGGATAWGNAALGGVIQLFTEPLTTAHNQIAVSAGDFSTHNEEIVLTQQMGPGTLQLSGNDFGTSGFPLVAKEDRGPIDIAAWSRHEWYSARWQQAIGTNADLSVTARHFDEQRGNGTPYQGNRSREDFGSAVLNVRPDKNFAWNASVYAQDQTFSSTFSSVNVARTAETPASDQYAVPAIAYGAAWTGVWTNDNQTRLSAGVDLRTVRGETRENYTFTNGSYTRQRIAGGAQDFAGLFALYEQPLSPEWRATVGARVDYWKDRDGHRYETDRTTGASLRDDHYASLDGTPFSPSAGLIWQPTKEWRVRGTAQQSFRRPTLNELYRPFRVGNVITEANPNLRTEHATSLDLGSDYTFGKFTFSADAFWNELHDAVGNVTLAHGPGTFPIVGFVPAGGIGRQRQNLDEVRVQGVEFSTRFDVSPALVLDAAYLYNDSEVTSASNAPVLVGKRLAQAPRATFSTGLLWRAPAKIKVNARIRWTGTQFEDDENSLPLAEATTVDLGLSFPTSSRGEFFLSVENLFSARVETGRVADGVTSVAPPRLARAGLRQTW